MIFDKELDVVELAVCDDDMTSLSLKAFGYGSLSLDSIPPFDIVTRELILESEDERAQRLKAEEEQRKKLQETTALAAADEGGNLFQRLADSAASHSPIRFSNSDAKRSKSKTIAKLQLISEYLPLKLSTAATSPSSSGDKSAPPPTDILFDLSPKGLTDELLAEEISLVNAKQPISDMATAAVEAVAQAHSKRLQHSQALAQQQSLHPGVLTISGIHGKNFKIDNSFTSTLRPYLVVSVGTVKHKTAIQKDYSNPYYTESFNFIVLDPMSTVLLVKVPPPRFPILLL
jgi:hypothetical protein